MSSRLCVEFYVLSMVFFLDVPGATSKISKFSRGQLDEGPHFL